jgi:hypothetical protein
MRRLSLVSWLSLLSAVAALGAALMSLYLSQDGTLQQIDRAMAERGGTDLMGSDMIRLVAWLQEQGRWNSAAIILATFSAILGLWGAWLRRAYR